MLPWLNAISCSKPHPGLFLKQYGTQMLFLSQVYHKVKGGGVWHSGLVRWCSDQGSIWISSVVPPFLEILVRRKRERVLFSDTVCPWHTGDTYLCIKDIKKCILHDRSPLRLKFIVNIFRVVTCIQLGGEQHDTGTLDITSQTTVH